MTTAPSSSLFNWSSGRLAGIFIVGFAVTVAGPFIPLFIYSVSFRWNWPDILPSEWWWEKRDSLRVPISWDYVLSPYSRLLEASLNTVLIGIGVSFIAFCICFPAARVFAREQFVGKPTLEFLFSLPFLIPEIAFALSLLLIFIDIGLAGSLPGVILAHLIPATPYMMRMLRSIEESVDTKFEEQARTLGANKFRVFFKVSLPLLLPGIITGCLFTFLVSSNIFLMTFLIGQGTIDTLPTILFARFGGGGIDPVIAGLTLMASMPGIVLFFFADRIIKDNFLSFN